MELFEANLLEHRSQGVDGNPFLVFVAFHLIANQAQRIQDFQYWIHHFRGPSEDQRAAGPENPIRLSQHRGWVRKMFEDREHHDMIELSWFQRQRGSNVSANAPPPAAHAVFDLVVDADAV